MEWFETLSVYASAQTCWDLDARVPLFSIPSLSVATHVVDKMSVQAHGVLTLHAKGDLIHKVMYHKECKSEMHWLQGWPTPCPQQESATN